VPKLYDPSREPGTYHLTLGIENMFKALRGDLTYYDKKRSREVRKPCQHPSHSRA